VGNRHGQETAKDARGLPSLPRPHPPRTARRRSGVNHWRATCTERCPRGSAEGRAEKDLPSRHLAARPIRWKAAWSLHSPGDPAAEDWVAVKALAVLAGDSTRAAAEITTETETAGLTAAQRTGADACVRYLTGKNEFLCYDQALAAGWPIATGVIEGACRHLIGDRLDITGARWGLDGAEAILTLRAVISNGDFDDYWGYHLDQEHQRLYPGTTQGQSLRVTLSLTPNEPHPSAIRSLTYWTSGDAS
jgi:hypothetical protein